MKPEPSTDFGFSQCGYYGWSEKSLLLSTGRVLKISQRDNPKIAPPIYGGVYFNNKDLVPKGTTEKRVLSTVPFGTSEYLLEISPAINGRGYYRIVPDGTFKGQIQIALTVV
ncbi:MAG: hypothetical protein R2681_17355 [Pyrinomonadaceae bacterium]